ncbi:type II toxin-antitoxin system prevent-host-death family antitoxin [Nocardia sp. NPDC049707]|uniref:type II toxin-antitoxin system Phd/YefM family antitoxin n=1 Tax=Nocardia sp. NPDC049707 TaxID=3154735 RepID=UPI003432CB27
MRESSVDIGIRELRDNLSRHLSEVRSGHSVTVTDHGRPIARIVPVGRPTRLEQLRAEGRVQPARKKKQPSPEPIHGEGMVSELIEEQRR